MSGLTTSDFTSVALAAPTVTCSQDAALAAMLFCGRSNGSAPIGSSGRVLPEGQRGRAAGVELKCEPPARMPDLDIV